jgi:hypothetical protein
MNFTKKTKREWMQPRLIKTQHAEYKPGVYSGKNESGWKPIGDKVLVLTDQMVDRTSGGVFISEELRDRMSMAAETGIIIDLGDSAFVWNADRSRPFTGQKPELRLCRALRRPGHYGQRRPDLSNDVGCLHCRNQARRLTISQNQIIIGQNNE